MSFHKIAPVKKARKAAPAAKHTAKKAHKKAAAPKKRPVSHQG